MKKYIKAKKRHNIPKAMKLIMAIFIAIGVLQIPGESTKIDNIVLANDGELNASFSPVTIEGGTNVYLGSQQTMYVGDNTLLSGVTSPTKVAGDNASVDGAHDLVWNDYDSKDIAVSSNILKNVTLPSIADMNKWQKYTGGKLTGEDFWLSDTENKKIEDGHSKPGDPDYDKTTFEIPLRGFSNGNGTLGNKTITISGKHDNGAWFDKRNFELGNYQNTNASPIEFKNLILPSGYYRDVFGKDRLKFESTILTYTNYNSSDSLGYLQWPGMKIDPDNTSSWANYYRSTGMKLYRTPECKPEDEVYGDYTLQYNWKTANPEGRVAPLIYNEETKTFNLIPVGTAVPNGTVIAYFFFDYKKVWKDNRISLEAKFLGDKTGVTKFKGTTTTWGPGMPDDTKFVPNQDVYLLFAKVNQTNAVRVSKRIPEEPDQEFPFLPTLDETFEYVRTDKPIEGSTLTGELNVVRPKMELDTNAVKFARAYDDTTIPSNSSILDSPMPTTNLVSSDNYKLVLNNSALGVNTLKKGTDITTNEGSKASVDKDNVISIAPGTTQITLPLNVKGGNKVSAIAKGKDNVTSKYGIVGDVNGTSSEITLNLEDLITDSKIGTEKTITFFNEQINGEKGMSDEIDANGQDITIRVANPQTIDFTDTTKTQLLNTTYSDKETFEVKAVVKEKGLVDLVDKTTPITFTADTNYLVQVGETVWDEKSLTATATFKVVKTQKAEVPDDKYMITINRSGTENNDPAPPVVSTKVMTLMKTYTIIYDLNAPPGESPSNHPENIQLEYTVDDTVVIKPPSLTGYTFTGWSERVTKGLDGADKDIVLPDEAGTVNDVDKTITINEGSIGHRKYTANWDVNKMKVDFDSDGGTSIESQNVDYKTTATYPEDPSRDGYIFNGWYKSIEGVMEEGQFDFTTLITEDIVLKAKWLKMPYSIKYNVESEKGVNNPSNKKLYNIESPDITILNPSEKYGYIFSGWTYDGQEIPLKSPVIPKGSFGDKEFTAVFTKEKYDVNFDLNGGTSSAIDIQNIEYQSKAISPLDPTRENYDFMGWYTEQIEDDAINPDETKKWDFNTNTVTQSITLYARWELTTHTVTFDGDNGTTHPEYVKHGNTLSNNYTTTKPYYTFDAWYTRTGNTEADYVYKQYDFNQPVTESFTLYAKWTKTPYTITYDKNHEDATGSTPSTIIHVGDTDKVFSSNSFLRDGYVFIGWNTKSDGSGTTYKAGDGILTDAPDNMIIYAQWVQEAVCFVEIPSSIQLKDGIRDTPDVGNALATEEIKVVIPNDVMPGNYPDDDIVVRTDVTFPLTLTSSINKFDVDVYKTKYEMIADKKVQTDERYDDASQSLVTLNTKDENKKIGYFTLKTPRSDLNSKGTYKGIMKFYISYAPKTKSTETK